MSGDIVAILIFTYICVDSSIIEQDISKTKQVRYFILVSQCDELFQNVHFYFDQVLQTVHLGLF